MKKLLFLLVVFLMGLPVSAKKQIGLQLYSIRDVIGSADKYAQNHVEVFKKLASWGYTAVEAANYDQGKGTFYGVSPE